MRYQNAARVMAALGSVVIRCYADTVLYINKCEGLFIWIILEVSRVVLFGIHFAMYIFLDFGWYMNQGCIYFSSLVKILSIH